MTTLLSISGVDVLPIFQRANILEFRSDQHRFSFSTRGFFVAPLLDGGQIASLSELFLRNFNLECLPTVYDTVADVPVQQVEQLHQMIASICQPSIDRLLTGHQIAACIFIAKKPGADGFNGFHIDATMTAEGFETVALWTPLCDVDEKVGRMCLLEGSQHFLPPYNIPSMPNAYEAVQATVGKMVTKVDMKAGDALFFDGTMLHGTESNLSDDVRIAAVIKLIPLGAPKVTAYYDESSPVGQQLSLYRHSDEFFIPKAFKSADPPDDSVFLGYIPSMPRRFTDSDLYSMIDGAQSNLGTTYP